MSELTPSLLEEVGRLYKVFTSMHRRCADPNNGNYGGRGISVDSSWETFGDFALWALNNGSAPGLELDRIDNDGPYAPGNCRWVTRSQNGQNKRNNRLITAFGETKPLAAWAADPRFEASEGRIRDRLNRGWPPERAISQPRHKPLEATHCKKGDHPWTPENTYMITLKNGRPWRACKACNRERNRKYRQAAAA